MSLLADVVTQCRIVVCAGSGGVGKTTTSAALGLLGAALGRRTLILTIDPAKRLASALGIQGIGALPTFLPVEALASAGISHNAPVAAMMLDLKAAWDDMIVRTAPSPEQAERILANRFYASLSRDLPGAQEFIACEALHHLVKSGEFDLIVLDTPPAQNAIDFLEAPSRILSVLDHDAFKFFANRRGGGPLSFLDGGLFAGASGKIAQVLSHFTGSEMLEELSDFIVLLHGLYEPLTRVTRELVALLGGDDARFVVVTSPTHHAVQEALSFVGALSARKLPLAAVVCNRVTPPIELAERALADAPFDAWCQTAGVSDADGLGAVLHQIVVEERAAAEHDAHGLRRLRLSCPHPLLAVPKLRVPVNDLRELAQLSKLLGELSNIAISS